MPQKSWILTDVESGTYLDDFSTKLDPFGRDEAWSVTKHTLRGGKQDGVDVVEVDNGRFRFALLPTRGMGLWRGWLGEAMLGWRSPNRGPVHPSFVPLMEPSGLGWLDGFDELLVRCGLESNGAPDFDDQGKLQYPLHGRIANLPAHRVEVRVDSDKKEIAVTGVVEETRFHFQKLRLTSTVTTQFGEAGLRLHDEVENLSAVEAQMQILYHVNFGVPLLDAGSRLVAPVKTLVPRNDHAASGVKSWDSYPAPEPGVEEQVYFFELADDDKHNTQVLLKNAHSTQGVSLRFNTGQLPCFTHWKNPPAVVDGYVTGLEPGTNYPNPRSYEIEQQRVVPLAPGAKQPFDLHLAWHADEKSVATAERAVAELQHGTTPRLFDKPQPGWCEG